MNRRVFKKTNSEKDNSDKIIDILKKVLDFNKQKVKGLKIWTPKQMFQKNNIRTGAINIR